MTLNPLVFLSSPQSSTQARGNILCPSPECYPDELTIWIHSIVPLNNHAEEEGKISWLCGVPIYFPSGNIQVSGCHSFLSPERVKFLKCRYSCIISNVLLGGMKSPSPSRDPTDVPPATFYSHCCHIVCYGFLYVLPDIH